MNRVEKRTLVYSADDLPSFLLEKKTDDYIKQQPWD